jgi:hypothetical protein
VPKPVLRPRACPCCGNAVRFCVYVFQIQVQHYLQNRPMKLAWDSNSPKAMNAQMSLLVCEDCATPLGVPPPLIKLRRRTRRPTPD